MLYINDEGKQDYSADLVTKYKKITETKSFIGKQKEMFREIRQNLNAITDQEAIFILLNNQGSSKILQENETTLLESKIEQEPISSSSSFSNTWSSLVKYSTNTNQIYKPINLQKRSNSAPTRLNNGFN